MNQRRLPNFFVVGAGKAGTTSLYHYLKAHPQIFMSPVKEPNFFATDMRAPVRRPRRRSLYVNGATVQLYGPFLDLDSYSKLFEEARDESVLGECSVNYLFSKAASREIKALIPDAKIIMILRNPVERAYSHYLMDIRAGHFRIPAAFERLCRNGASTARDHFYIQAGLYSAQIKRYLDTFPRERVEILLYEDMQTGLNKLISNMYAFLEVDSNFFPPAIAIHNQARVPRSRLLNILWGRTPGSRIASQVAPRALSDALGRLYYYDRPPGMPPETRKFLIKVFSDDIGSLQEIIDRDLSGWLR